MNSEAFTLDEDAVTMLRGVAYVDGGSCRITTDASKAELVLTFGGDEGERPTVVAVLAAMPPEVRLALEGTEDDYFYIGTLLRAQDTKGPACAR